MHAPNVKADASFNRIDPEPIGFLRSGKSDHIHIAAIDGA
jgi:hypothetical protein